MKLTPYDLIGRPYCLGGDFINREGGDCLTLARHVLNFYGVSSPKPQRSWYRRLRKGDTAVFKDELEKWGELSQDIDYGTIALCHSPFGYGMASYFDRGWLSFTNLYGELVVRFNPITVLQVEGLYSPMKYR